MDRNKAKDVFISLFKNIDGFAVSMTNRKKLDLQVKELTYGEVEFDSYATLLDYLDIQDDETFYDLGAGTGKAVVTTALLTDCKKAIGIELLEDVYNVANEIKERYDEYIATNTEESAPKTQIEYVKGDIINVDFSDGDVIYIASTCFDREFMTELAKKCELLKPGSRIATLTKELLSPELEQEYKLTLPMSWGNTTVYIYKRK